MSLYKYKVDFSALTPEEKSDLFSRIEDKSYNGFFFDPVSQSGSFFVYDDNLDLLTQMANPAVCHLTRIYQ